jgi:hypothetical protein
MKISKVQEAVSGLNRSWSRPCFFVAAFLLAVVGEATVAAVHGGEEDDIKALRQLENDIAQAWVQRDTQTLDRILAGDYTFAGAGDVLIDKEQWVAGVDYPGIRTTSAIVDDLRIRVYGDAAVVTGRAVYRGWSKKSGEFVHRFRFTDTFTRRTLGSVSPHTLRGFRRSKSRRAARQSRESATRGPAILHETRT